MIASSLKRTFNSDNPKERATSAYLNCITTAVVKGKTVEADLVFETAMSDSFKRTFATKAIEKWLETADLNEQVREYIRQKTVAFKRR